MGLAHVKQEIARLEAVSTRVRLSSGESDNLAKLVTTERKYLRVKRVPA